MKLHVRAAMLKEEKQRLEFILNYTDLPKRDITKFNLRLLDMENEAREIASKLDPRLADLFLMAADYLDLCSEATQDELCAARQKFLIRNAFPK